ncbi:unnamed protein product [Timema podura]|uniref:NADH dehydrogenase subunit 6 n=1 Tax=Timema podura TaxID=61482 RepID=A0ABN7NFC5_TIMPD|nr:unnamed protein product [Timema podura]
MSETLPLENKIIISGAGLVTINVPARIPIVTNDIKMLLLTVIVTLLIPTSGTALSTPTIVGITTTLISLVFVGLLNILVHGAALPVGVSPFQETLKSEGTVHRPLVYAYPKYSAYTLPALLEYQQTPELALRDPMVQSLSHVNVKSAMVSLQFISAVFSDGCLSSRLLKMSSFMAPLTNTAPGVPLLMLRRATPSGEGVVATNRIAPRQVAKGALRLNTIHQWLIKINNNKNEKKMQVRTSKGKPPQARGSIEYIYGLFALNRHSTEINS